MRPMRPMTIKATPTTTRPNRATVRWARVIARQVPVGVEQQASGDPNAWQLSRHGIGYRGATGRQRFIGARAPTCRRWPPAAPAHICPPTGASHQRGSGHLGGDCGFDWTINCRPLVSAEPPDAHSIDHVPRCPWARTGSLVPSATRPGASAAAVVLIDPRGARRGYAMAVAIWPAEQPVTGGSTGAGPRLGTRRGSRRWS